MHGAVINEHAVTGADIISKSVVVHMQGDRPCIGVNHSGAARNADGVSVAESDGFTAFDRGESNLWSGQVSQDADFQLE